MPVVVMGMIKYIHVDSDAVTRRSPNPSIQSSPTDYVLQQFYLTYQEGKYLRFSTKQVIKQAK